MTDCGIWTPMKCVTSPWAFNIGAMVSLKNRERGREREEMVNMSANIQHTRIQHEYRDGKGETEEESNKHKQRDRERQKNRKRERERMEERKRKKET